jgi:hypothetical protein
MFQKKAHGRAFQCDASLRPLRQAGYECGYAIAVEIVGADQVWLCPSREFPYDGPLPQQRFIGIAGGAKVLEKRFDLVFEQTL